MVLLTRRYPECLSTVRRVNYILVVAVLTIWQLAQQSTHVRARKGLGHILAPTLHKNCHWNQTSSIIISGYSIGDSDVHTFGLYTV